MKHWLMRILGVAILAAPVAVLAGGRYHGGAYYDYAQVLDVDPIFQRVSVAQPRRECWTENVVHRRPRRSNSMTPEILGVIVGGVVGNQFGSGSGQDIATVAGAILGGSIAHDVDRPRGYAGRAWVEPVRRCQVSSAYHRERRVVGYDVKYCYDGQVFRTRMHRDPGRRVRVRVDVAVVR